MAAGKKPFSSQWWVRAALILAAVVRLVHLGAEDFSEAEAVRISGVDGSRPSGGEPLPLVPTLVTQSAAFLGDSEGRLRLPFALIGVATVVALSALGARLFGAEVALYAALLAGLSAFHVGLSRQVSPDVVLSGAATAAILGFSWVLHGPDRPWRWAVFAGSALLLSGCGKAGGLPLFAIALASVILTLRGQIRGGTAVRVLVIVVGLALLALWGSPHRAPALMRLNLDVAAARLLVGAWGDHPGAVVAGILFLGVALLGATTWRGFTVVAWAVIGLGGVVIMTMWDGLIISLTDCAFVLPAYLLLVSAGAARLRRALTAHGPRWRRVGGAIAMGGAFVALQLPELGRRLQAPGARWRDTAAIVRANIRPDDALVVLLDQHAFLHYAPDLRERIDPTIRPARVPLVFVHPDRSWLIAPTAARFHPGWPQIQRWIERFVPLDLSPDDQILVLYFGRSGLADLRLEAAHFELPVSTLMHGRLLSDLLQEAGPLPPLLWKVDQLALTRAPLPWHNPALLETVSVLADRGHGDRAASLAYRLATTAPSWGEAQRVLAAFRPSSSP